MDQISEHFTKNELACKCCGRLALHPQFLEKLEHVRALYGKPMAINSGYRCEVHNTLIGGVSSSAHLDGNAVDVAIIGSVERYCLIAAAVAGGATGIGVYQRWIHIDFMKRQFGRCVWVGK